MGIKMDGKALADKICINLKQRCEKLKTEYKFEPTLNIFTAENDSIANLYLRSKLKRCEEIGIKTVVKDYKDLDYNEFLIAMYPLNPTIVEKPFYNFTQIEVARALLPQVDVDCLNYDNIGRMYSVGSQRFTPCTPKGIMRLLKEYGVDFKDKNALVIGRSDTVGHPMAWLLEQAGCTVTLAHSGTNESWLTNFAVSADIIVSAVGKLDIISFQEFNDECFGMGERILSDKVIVDVGMNFQDGILVGDFTEDFKSKAALWNSVRGCIGPMTTISLCENVLEFYEKQIDD